MDERRRGDVQPVRGRNAFSPDGKPEKRRYRAVYLAKNKPVGQYSDIVTIVTTP
jgi:hypothetical protein